MFKLALKNLFRRKYKTFLICILFITLITFILIFGGIKKSIYYNIEDMLKKSFSGSYYITSYDKFNSGFLSLGIKLPKSIDIQIVKQIDKINNDLCFSKRIKVGSMLYIENTNEYNFSIIIGIDPEKEKNILKSMNLSNNSIENLSNILTENKIIIAESQNKENKLKKGDNLIAFIKHISGYFLPYEFIVEDFYNNDLIKNFKFDLNIIFINIKYLQNILGVDNSFVTDIVFLDKENKYYSKINDIAIKRNLTFVSAKDSFDIFSGLIDFLSIFFFIAEFLIISILIIIIINSMLSSIFDRKKEIGTMYSFGFSKSKVVFIFLLEYIFIFLISYFFSILIYFMLIQLTKIYPINIKLLSFYLKSNPLSILFDIKYIYLALLIPFFSILIGIIFPSKILFKFEIVELLKE